MRAVRIMKCGANRSADEDTRVFRWPLLIGDPLHLVEGNLIPASVIEPSGPGTLVTGHLLGDLETAAILQIIRDPRCPEL